MILAVALALYLNQAQPLMDISIQNVRPVQLSKPWSAEAVIKNPSEREFVAFSRHPGELIFVFRDKSGALVEHLNYHGNIEWRSPRESDVVTLAPGQEVRVNVEILTSAHRLVKPGEYTVELKISPSDHTSFRKWIGEKWLLVQTPIASKRIEVSVTRSS